MDLHNSDMLCYNLCHLVCSFAFGAFIERCGNEISQKGLQIKIACQ